MKILVIDTATEACSVALYIDNTIWARYEVCPQQHSQKLLPMVDSVLQEAGYRINDLDALGFGHGPGSFTGVRIATGMIQGLALATSLPVVGVSTMAAMAQQMIERHGANHVAVAIDARMNEVYFAQYANNNGIATLIGEEQVCAPVAAQEQIAANTDGFAGTGWQAYDALQSCISDNKIPVSFPSATFMLPLVKLAIERGEGQDVAHVTPVYLRDTVTWKKLPGRE